jgi:hypothetical protein
MRTPLGRTRIAALLSGVAFAVAANMALARSGQEAEQLNDLRDFRIGLKIEDLPSSGYVGLSCAGAADQVLSGWEEYRRCPADSAGQHEIRFRYNEAANPLARVNDKFEGTKVAGHPVLLSLLIGGAGQVDGIRIVTDPQARLYLRKKAFLLGLQAKARYGEDGWACTEGQPVQDEQPVGGVFVKEHCEKTTPTRHLVVERSLFRRPGQDPKEFVNDTKITILPPG